jgi:5-methylcytosine-specific restriction endonuclease McrA
VSVDKSCLPHTKVRGHCDRCGNTLRGRQRRWCSKGCSTWYYINHVWTFARSYVLAERGRTCERCGSPDDLEVDHIVPRNGMPMATHSCLHHGGNLRVLCHHCHITRKDWWDREQSI